MPRMMIDVPAAIRRQIDNDVAEGGFDDAGAYVARLVREERKRKAHARVEGLIRERLESGDPVPLTADFWKQRERNLQARLAQANGTPKKHRPAANR